MRALLIKYGFWLIFLLAAVITVVIGSVDNKYADDIESVYQEGQTVLSLENPYQRIATSDMRTNDKYATYLPGIYYLSALIQISGADEFADWLIVWRILSAAAYLAIGSMIYWFLQRFLGISVALGAASLWFFNSFCITVLSIAHTDFIAVLPLLSALIVLRSKPRLAYLLFGISLSLKHLGIIILPLLVIDLYRQKGTISAIWQPLIWMLLLPLIASSPYLLGDPVNFVKSFLFSATRLADSHAHLVPLSMLIAPGGLVTRLPLLIALLTIYSFFAQAKLTLAVAVSLGMFCFIILNPVVYNQYYVWLFALLPFAFVNSRNSTVQRTR